MATLPRGVANRHRAADDGAAATQASCPYYSNAARFQQYPIKRMRQLSIELPRTSRSKNQLVEQTAYDEGDAR